MIISLLLKLLWITIVPTAVLTIISISLYDFKSLKETSNFKRHPFKKSYRKRRLISILIETKDDEQTIEKCLQSLTNNRYKNMEVVIADNASEDKTCKLVRQFIRINPKTKVKLYSKRVEGDQISLLKDVTKKYVKGDLILKLSANSITNKNLLPLINQQFAIQKPDALKVNYMLQPSLYTTQVFQEFNCILRNSKLKATLNLNKYKKLSLEDNQVYTFSTFEALLKSSKPVRANIAYSSSSTVYIPATSLYKALKPKTVEARSYILPNELSDLFGKGDISFLATRIYESLFILVGAMLPLIFGYFIYLAMNLKQPDLLAIAWLGIIAGLVFAINEYEGISKLVKLKLLSLSPLSLAWVYLQGLIYIIKLPLKTSVLLKD